MPVKRSRLTILVDVMKALQGEGRPASRICEYANLPYDRLVPILEKLEKEGFVVYEKKGKARIYKLTEKGLKELSKLEDALRILRKLGLE